MSHIKSWVRYKRNNVEAWEYKELSVDLYRDQTWEEEAKFEMMDEWDTIHSIERIHLPPDEELTSDIEYHTRQKFYHEDQITRLMHMKMTGEYNG